LYWSLSSSVWTANLPPAPIHVSGGRSVEALVNPILHANGGTTRTRE
jgi:hypothetical protein